MRCDGGDLSWNRREAVEGDPSPPLLPTTFTFLWHVLSSFRSYNFAKLSLFDFYRVLCLFR